MDDEDKRSPLERLILLNAALSRGRISGAEYIKLARPLADQASAVMKVTYALLGHLPEKE